jgi:hypothetical protein
MSELPAVGRDLTFQTLDHLVERGIDIVAGPGGSESTAAPVAGDLYPMACPHSGVEVADDLDLELGHPRVEPLDLPQLVLGAPTDLVGDPDPPPPEDEIHSPSPFSSEPESGSGPADLVFGPTLACRGDHRPMGAV